MIKINVHTLTAIILASSPLHASEQALAGYGTNCQHTQAELKANPIKVPEELMPFVANDSSGHRLKLRMTQEEYKIHYSLIQMHPYISVILEEPDKFEFPQSEIASPNSSSTTQPDKP